MKKENFRLVLKEKDPKGVKIPWFAPQEQIISGWLRAPQRV